LRQSPWGDCTAQAWRPQSLQGSKGLAESDRASSSNILWGPNKLYPMSFTYSIDTLIFSSYINTMRIEFDPIKDVSNQIKHGLSLGIAEELDWESALVWVDDRFEYNEMRMIALAPKTETLYYVAFVDRVPARRIISLRRANRREVKHYVENF
jgi:uncharacterized protein